MSSDKEHPVGDERSRKCDKCGKRDAVIHQVVVENGNVYEWHLCMECAAVEGFGADTVSGRRDSEMDKEEDGPVCPSCGMTLSDFRRTKKMGCSVCYDTFSDYVARLLEKYHGSSYYKGSAPGTPGTAKTIEKPISEDDLRLELESAVKREDYERAAEIRDMLEEMERNTKNDAE